MKKLSSFIVMMCLLTGCSNATTTSDALGETNANTTVTSGTTSYVDTYSSASTTKQILDSEKASEVLNSLTTVDSDLASKAETEVEGYVAPEGETAPIIMSVNPDGSVGLSTIHAWMVNPEANSVEVELTYGQNALNLAEVGKRGSLLTKVDGTYYLLHLNVTVVDELKYSDEAYQAGEFNSAYSGADAQLSEYHITFDVLSVEQVFVLLLS